MLGTDLFIRFIGLDLVSRVAERAGNSIDRMENRIRRGGIAASQSLIAAGIAATTFGVSLLAVAGGLSAIAANSVEAAAQFRSDMVMVVTHAGLARDQVDSVSEALMRMAPAVGFGPDELAKAFYHVQSATTSLPERLQTVAAKEDILRQAAMLAAVGHADLTDTTNTLLSVLASYGRTSMTAADAAAQLNAIVGNGNVTMQQFDSAMRGGLLPVAAQAGVHLNSLGAAFGTLTDMGYGASQAATYLRSAIIQMSIPSGPASKALQAIGLSGDQAAKQMGFFNEILHKAGINQTVIANELQKSGSLSHVLNDVLEPALRKAGLSGHDAAALIERSFGGIRSGAGIVGLTDNLQGLADKENLIQRSTSEWASTWKYFASNDPAFVIKQMRASFDVLRITIGDALMPTFLQLANFLGPLIMRFRDWVNSHKELVAHIVVASIAVAGIAGTLLMLAGGILIISGSIGVLGGAIAATFAGGAGLLAPIMGAFAGIGSAMGNLMSVMLLIGSVGSEASTAGFGFALLGPTLGGLAAAAWPAYAAIAAIAAALVIAKDEVAPLRAAVATFREEFQKTHSVTVSLMLGLQKFGFAGKDAQDVAHGLRDAWRLASSILSGAGDAIGKAFRVIASSIPHEDLVNFNRALGEMAAAFTNNVLPVLKVVGVVLAALIGGLFQALVQWLSVVIPAAVHIFTGVFEIIAGVINFVGDTFKGLFRLMDDLFHGRWNKLSQDARETNDRLWRDIQQIWQGIKDTILGLLQGTIVAAMVGVAGFVDGFLGVLARIPGPVGDRFREAKTNMDIVLAEMRYNAGSAGTEVGENFGAGLQSGIIHYIPGIKDAALRAIQDAKLAADEAQNAGSPSRLMRDTTGRWFAEGMALGINDGTPTVRRAAIGMVDSAHVGASSVARQNSEVGSADPGGSDDDRLVSLLSELVDEVKRQGRSNRRAPDGTDNSNLIGAALQAVNEKAARGRLTGQRAVFA